METLYGGYTLELCPGAFPLSTDSMALAAFAKLPRGARVLDLGSGCGTLGLLLCGKDPSCTADGIELDENAHAMAQQNILRNGLSSRMTSICADLRTIPGIIAPGSYHCCISNPPYFTGGPASRTVPLARRDDCCSLPELFAAAAWALKFGGDFFLVHRPERLAELCAAACAAGLEPKRLQLLHHREGGSVSLILLQCRKGAKPGLNWEDISLYDPSGNPTAAYREIFHLKEA